MNVITIQLLPVPKILRALAAFSFLVLVGLWALSTEPTPGGLRYEYRSQLWQPAAYVSLGMGVLGLLILTVPVLRGSPTVTLLELDETTLRYVPYRLTIPWGMIERIETPRSEKIGEKGVLVIYWRSPAEPSGIKSHFIDLRMFPEKQGVFERVLHTIEARSSLNAVQTPWPTSIPRTRILP